MSDRVPALTALSTLALDDLLYAVDVSDTTDHASGSSRKVTAERLAANLHPGIFTDGRLTAVTGTPIYAPQSLTPSATDTTADTCDFAAAHGWVSGTMITPETTVGGLTAGTTYYINATDSDTVSFHTNLADSLSASSKVNLTASITSRLWVLGVQGGTLYYAPYKGNRIALFDGTRWGLYSFTERSLSLTLTVDKNYDVFLYDNAGTLTLELSAAWTTDTARADALTTQDGVYVKSGATTRRWLGTIRAAASNTIEDSKAKRFVWNAYNQITLPLERTESTATWTYTTATWRQANASTANQVAWVCGDVVSAHAEANAFTTNSTAGVGRSVGVGFDSTTSPSGITARQGTGDSSNESECFSATFNDMSPAGYHFLAWLEISTATGTTTWNGTSVPILRTGICGHISGG